MKPSRRPAAIALAALVAASVPALAQPGATPPTPPPADGAAPPPAEAPSPDRADYDDAFAAMVAGDLPRAIVGFDAVAARATDPQLAGAARELARLARELTSHGIRFTHPGDGEAEREAAVEDKEEGRASFIVTSTVYGLYAGVVAIDDLNIDDVRVGIVTVTGTTALGLFGSWYGTKGRTMTGAMADGYQLGMIEGFANAGLLVEPVGLAKSSAHVQTTLLLSGAVGGTAGLLYGWKANPTRGQLSFAGTVSLLGFASTGLSFGLFLPKDLSGDSALTLMAGGTDVGLAAGLVLGDKLDWSASRGRIVQLGALVGGLAGVAVGAIVTGASASTDTDTRILTGSTLAGLWAGFAIAMASTNGMRPDPRFAAPGTSGGAAAGPSAQLAPIAVRGGGGLAVVGSF